MLELRILTGLQAGARLKLPSGCHRLGHDDDCDILVRGYGVDAVALQLVIEQQHVVAIPMQSGCGTRLSDSQDAPFILAPGQAFHIGELWLAVDEEEVPWPQPQQWRQATEMLGDAQQAGAADAAAVPATSAPSASMMSPAYKRLRRSGTWLTAICTILLVCSCTLAYALKTPAEDKLQPVEAPPSTAGDDVPPVLAMTTELSTVPDAAPPLTAELKNHATGAERASAATLPDTDVGPVTELPTTVRQLPFTIKRIVSGPMPYVVADGDIRIFEGGTYQGFRLASLKEHKLIFQGSKQVDIDW